MVEGARLESVCRGNSTVGSNPTLSAKFRSAHLAERAGLGVMPRRATARREQDRIPLLRVVASRVPLAAIRARIPIFRFAHLAERVEQDRIPLLRQSRLAFRSPLFGHESLSSPRSSGRASRLGRHAATPFSASRARPNPTLAG